MADEVAWAKKCTRVKREIKLHFQDNALSMIHIPFIRADFYNFCQVRLCFRVLNAHVTLCYEKRPIHELNEDRWSSLKAGGMRRNSIRQRIIFKTI